MKAPSNPVVDPATLVPPFVVDLAKSLRSLRDIDRLDDKLFSMPPERIKELYDQLDFAQYSQYMQSYVEKHTYSPIKLTALLRINGKPFTLAKHRFFEPLFYPSPPPKMLLVCARQLGKSTHLAAQGVIQAGCTGRLRLLYLAPQFEQIRRFSHQYIKPFVHESFMRSQLTDHTCIDSVLHKTFRNGSVLWFSFALLSVERVRGIACDGIRLDEVQDLNPEFLDIIRECTSSSENRSEMYAGTSKTVDNLIEQLRLKASQAEWFIRCEACNHWNIPTLEGSGPGLGVMDMIQDEGLCCCKCKRPINAEKGQWVHKFPERAEGFPSYHVSQVISPIHYDNPRNWQTLLYKRDNVSRATFINEVLGEACDEGQRLVSRTELEAVCVLGPNDRQLAQVDISKYSDRVLGVDWGGKGTKLQSMTATAVACVGVDNKIDIVFGHVYPGMLDSVMETRDVVKMADEMRCSAIAHDVAVAGELRLSIMRDLGVPENRLANCRYSGSGQMKSMVAFMPASDINPTSYYNIDKSRLIAAVCLAIKNKMIRFPHYQSLENASGDNILHHFLAIYEETIETTYGGERRFIRRNVGMPDDFLHAVAFAVLTLWVRYPDIQPNLREYLFANDDLEAHLPDPSRMEMY